MLGTTAPCPPGAPSTTADPGAALAAAHEAEQRPRFLFFLKEVYQDWENHKAGLKSLHGEREQTFITN